MAKAGRQADVAATIERKNNKAISLLKDIATMLKPEDEKTVNWQDIYLNEDEFLLIENSIESDVESQDIDSSQESEHKVIEYDKKHKMQKSFSMDPIKFK